MGNNNLAGFLRHRGSLPLSSQIQLGTYATINMKTFISRMFPNGTYIENAEVLYTVEGSKCKLVLEKDVSTDGNVRVVSFVLHDNIICSNIQSLPLVIFKICGFLETYDFIQSGIPIPWTKTKKNVDARDGVTDTKVYLYGNTNRCGLLVFECKKNDDSFDVAKAVTVAHYFVSSNGFVAVNRRSETTDISNIGFSVVAKVGVCDGKLDISVEGPEPHPVSGLLYMFDEVNRSGIWKPSMCPHCRNIRREQSRMFLQSDSEDDVVALPPRLGNQRNGTTITNDGRFRGHASGSSIRCRNFYGFN